MARQACHAIFGAGVDRTQAAQTIAGLLSLVSLLFVAIGARRGVFFLSFGCICSAESSRQDRFVETFVAMAMLGEDQGLESAGSITRDVAPERASVGEERLGAAAVAVVGSACGLVLARRVA